MKSRDPRRCAEPAGADALALLLVVLAVVIAHGPGLRNGPVDLDWHLVASGNLLALTGVQAAAFYPVFHATLAADRLLWPRSFLGPHAQNVALHMACALLVFGLARRLLRRCGLPRGAASAGAAVAGALFGAHPALVEPVAWVQGRDVLLAGVLSLAAFHAYLSSHKSGNRIRRRAWRVGAAVAFLAACLSNAAAAPLPLALTAHETLVQRRAAGRVLRRTADLWLIGAVALFLRWPGVLVEAPAPGDLMEEALPATWPVRLRALGAGLLALVAPSRLTPLYARAPAGWRQPHVALALLAVACSLGGVWRLSKGGRAARLAAFAVAWFWILLAPTAGHHLVRADRFFYLPAVGLCLLTGLGAGAALRTRAGAPVLGLACGATLCLALLAAAQTGVWRDSISLWSHAAGVCPGQATVWNNLGCALVREGRFAEAIGAFSNGVAAAPDHATLRYNLAITLQQGGRLREAERQYEALLARRPDDAEALHNLGLIRLDQGRREEARALFERSARAAPGFDQAHYRLGLIALEGEAPEEAIVHLEAAVRANPSLAAPRAALARALFRAGRRAEARAAAEAAARCARAAGDRAAAEAMDAAAREYAAEGPLLGAVEASPNPPDSHGKIPQETP